MAQYIRQAPILGRVGESLGAGLADVVPKEAERYRLKQGLKNIQNNPGATQFERLSNLYTIPGLSENMANQLAPMLNQAAVKQARQNGRQGLTNQNQRSVNQQIIDKGQPQPTQEIGQPFNQFQQQTQYQPKETTSKRTEKKNPSITTQAAQQAVVQPILHASPEQIVQRGYELEDQYGLTPEAARDEAVREDANRVENEKEMQALAGRENIAESNLKTKLDDKVKQKTHKDVGTGQGGLFDILPGEVYNRFLKKAETLKNQGKTDTQATDQVSDDVKEIVKDINTMSNNIGGRPFFGKTSSQLNKDINSLKNSFEKNGELELFKDIQMDKLDIGDHEASLNTWKPSKDLEKEIINSSVEDSPKEIAARLYKHITPNDSIFSIGNLLNRVGINDADVVNELNDLYQNKIFKPDERQARELSEYYPAEYGLGDILWSSFKEFVPHVAIPRYLLGYKEKVPAVEKIKRYSGKR